MSSAIAGSRFCRAASPKVEAIWETSDGPPPPPGRPEGFIARMRSGGLDLRNTWQIVVGAVLLPLGLAVIVLGWNGAAHGRVDQQQIPYLISGGILGLASVMVGCFFFWAHWLYRIYDQADLHHQEAMRQQAELIQVLLESADRRPADEGAAIRHEAHSHNGAGKTYSPPPPAATSTPPAAPSWPTKRRPSVRSRQRRQEGCGPAGSASRWRTDSPVVEPGVPSRRPGCLRHNRIGGSPRRPRLHPSTARPHGLKTEQEHGWTRVVREAIAATTRGRCGKRVRATFKFYF